MTVAFRYVARELLTVFLITTAVLLLIGLGGRFVGYLQEAALGNYAADALMVMLAYRLPEFLQLTMPFAFFLTCVLTVSRLWAEQELTVLVASGTSPMRLLAWLLCVGVTVASVVAVLTVSVAPRAQAALADFVLTERLRREFESITPGVFHTQNQGERVTYAEGLSADRQELTHVFVAERRDDGREITVWAERGTQFVSPETGSRFIRLDSGRRYEGQVGAVDYRVAEFGSLSQRVEHSTETVRRTQPEAQPTAALDLRDPAAAAEWHWRIGLPIATLVSVVFAFGLSRVAPRQGRFARMLPAIVAYMIYLVMLLLNQNALAEGRIPAGLGLWAVHGMFLLVGVLTVRRMLMPARI